MERTAPLASRGLEGLGRARKKAPSASGGRCLRRPFGSTSETDWTPRLLREVIEQLEGPSRYVSLPNVKMGRLQLAALGAALDAALGGDAHGPRCGAGQPRSWKGDYPAAGSASAGSLIQAENTGSPCQGLDTRWLGGTPRSSLATATTAKGCPKRNVASRR